MSDSNKDHFCIFIQEMLSQPETSEILGYLQKKLRLNLNILLYCCWLAYSGGAQLNRRELFNILNSIAPWQRLVTSLNKLHDSLTFWRNPSLATNIQHHILQQLSIIEKNERIILADSNLKPFDEKSTNYKITDACKNLTLYLRELPIGMDQQDTSLIKRLLCIIFPDADQRKLAEFWGADKESKRRKAYRYLEQLDLF